MYLDWKAIWFSRRISSHHRQAGDQTDTFTTYLSSFTDNGIRGDRIKRSGWLLNVPMTFSTTQWHIIGKFALPPASIWLYLTRTWQKTQRSVRASRSKWANFASAICDTRIRRKHENVRAVSLPGIISIDIVRRNASPALYCSFVDLYSFLPSSSREQLLWKIQRNALQPEMFSVQA